MKTAMSKVKNSMIKKPVLDNGIMLYDEFGDNIDNQECK